MYPPLGNRNTPWTNGTSMTAPTSSWATSEAMRLQVIGNDTVCGEQGDGGLSGRAGDWFSGDFGTDAVSG